MRRYDDPVEVLRGPVRGEGGRAMPAPEQFLWHGRLWKIRSVVAHWVETAPWWHSVPARAVLGEEAGGVEDREGALGQRDWDTLQDELLAEREFWRVVAGRPGSPQHGMTSGVFDLAHDRTDDCWQLVGCQD